MSRAIPRVLLGPSTFGEADPGPRAVLAEAGLEVVENPYARRLTRDEIQALLDPSIVGLIAGLEPLDREVLSRSRLRVVSRCGAGLSNVDLSAAADLGISVQSTPDAPTAAVAELVIAAILSLLRKLPEMNAAMHDGGWSKTVGGQLESKTLVIVGLGRIGQRVARLLAPFGVKLLGVDPALSESPVDGMTLEDLDDALPRADLITLHCSGESEVLGEREFGLLRDGALVLNCARGGVLDEGALQAAIDSGRVAGAWLDCFVEEPYEGPLRDYPQVLLTPHVGSYTKECRLRMETEAATNLINELLRIESADE